ncbi:MAG: hypothetical protein K6T35_01925, partial [Meiothermus silvanus]|nr:hypothetical protein [Allomeiothermus silvanus]
MPETLLSPSGARGKAKQLLHERFREPLTLAEIDLIRTDVFTPALAGLLPPQPVRPGDRWAAAGAAVQELTDLEKMEEGQVECRLEQLVMLEKRRHARVGFRGAVR